MSVQLNTKSLDKLEAESSKSIHYLPCKIKGDSKANVSQYFSRFILDKDDQTCEVTYRGRPFNGKIINLPNSYRGVVFVETLKPKSLKAERKFHAIRSFRSFHYWNWDKVPSKNDALMCALDWIDISKAIHSPAEKPLIKNELKNENGAESDKNNCNGLGNEKKNLNGDSAKYPELISIKTECIENGAVKSESENTEMSVENDVVKSESENTEMSIENDVVKSESESTEMSIENDVVKSGSENAEMSIENDVVKSESENTEMSIENDVVKSKSENTE